jgi:hypothetical protein
MVDGQTFKVTDKHLAGIVFFAAISSWEIKNGTNYKLVFDADRTKIAWGLTNRTQATHFARINKNAITPTEKTRLLLEMADVCAYGLSHALLARRESGNRKLRKFARLAQAMAIDAPEFKWAPEADKPDST